jgi:hypothetical protein
MATGSKVCCLVFVIFFSGCPAAALWALICVGDTTGFLGPFVSRGLSSWEVFAVLPYDAEHVEFL